MKTKKENFPPKCAFWSSDNFTISSCQAFLHEKRVQEEWSTNHGLYVGLNTSFLVQLEQKMAQRESILVPLIVMRMGMAQR